MATPTVNVTLPGRLGNPTLELQSDPRTDPRLVAAFAPLGLGGAAPTLPVDRQSPVEELLAVAAATEQAFDTVFSVLLADVRAPRGHRDPHRDHHGRRRQRHHAVHRPARRRHRAIAGAAAPARRRNGDIAVIHRDQLARGAGGRGVRRRRRGVPQCRWRTWPTPVPGRPERLLQRAGLDARRTC